MSQAVLRIVKAPNLWHCQAGSRVQMPKWCPQCERKIEASEIKKGYEMGEGHIILEETDFQSLPLIQTAGCQAIATPIISDEVGVKCSQFINLVKK